MFSLLLPYYSLVWSLLRITPYYSLLQSLLPITPYYSLLQSLLPITPCYSLLRSLLPITPYCFPGGSLSKESACNAQDPGSIPGWGRSPGEKNGNPLQNACLENPMNGRPWQATVHSVAESDSTERLTLSLFPIAALGMLNIHTFPKNYFLINRITENLFKCLCKHNFLSSLHNWY